MNGDYKHIMQAWRKRKRQARGHHSPFSIQDEWLAIDGQKNNILASLYLPSCKSSKQNIVYYAEVISVLVCVCVCVCV